MIIEYLEHDGVGYGQMTADELLKAGLPDAVVLKAAASAAQKAAEAEVDRLGDRLAVSPSRSARYQQKLKEAQAYLEAGSPNNVSAEDYPILVPEASARGMKKADLAAAIVARAKAFAELMGMAEATRASVAVKIASAATLAEVEAATEEAIAPFRAAVQQALAA